MEDIGKELCERVRAALEERNSRNAFMVRLKKEIAEGKATMRDTSLYSQTLGIHLRSAIKEVVTPDELPDSTLYYNIAHSILEPLLRDTYEDVNAICAEVQRKLDDKAGIHLAPQKADFPAERVRAACGSASVKDTAEHGIEVLERTSENITAAFSDDYMKANADFRARAGLDVYIERRSDGKCCPWCTGIAGRYQYGSEPHDIYRRHDNCGCTVEYVSSRGRQNVWSKRENSPLYDKEYLKERDKIKAAEREHRRQLGLNYKGPVRLSRKQARELEERMKLKLKGELTSSPKSGIMLPDIVIGRSAGAKARNYDIMDLATGEFFHLVEGSHLQDVEVFAGKGGYKPYEKAYKYAEKYGGKIEDWQHVKGHGLVDYYGEERLAELHWSQCDGYGKHDFFVKRWLDED